ncbi:armadillo repeat-containing protein 6 [Nematostella vectensis]|uniref:armadillo repeat-containing protein 6 n=1 Tax=Nematostella vectensis TaxID=45351 RepID=UPI0020778742|nr:armadillo repeat-containing protein 6 [Nematostella vectensis]
MNHPKKISQETFDAVVRENIEEFEMDLDEAVSDAMEQFVSQGVDLSNLITSYVRDESCEGGLRHSNPVKDALSEIQASSSNDNKDHLIKAFASFQAECNSENNRKFAASHNAIPILLSSFKAIKGDKETLCRGLEAFGTFVNGQANIIDRETIEFLCECLKDSTKQEGLLEVVLICVNHSCIKSESNRQTFVELGTIPILIDVLGIHKQNSSVIKETCFVLRVLTFDDDMSVPFGKAHEHAKQIVADNGISALMDVMEVCGENVEVVSELCATLGRLFVRDEFCKEFIDIGGLKVMLKILEEKIDHQAVVKQVCFVLRVLAGNDDVKKAIVATQGMALIVASMTKHAKQAFVAEQGCAALASIALRMPDNCAAIINAGGHEVILKAMQMHPGVVGVQKQGCLAIRNLVARNPENCEPILGAGGEAQIRYAYNTYPESHDLAKAALRDLQCDVELRELWTGSGQGIQRPFYE